MPDRNVEGDYRYAFQGQEKDAETGKEAFQLRLWVSRIGRWLSPDPYGEFSSPYLGMGNNPLKFVDIDGGRIVVSSADGSRYDYRNGQLYSVTDGTLYEGNDDYLIQTRGALKKLDYGVSTYGGDENGNLERRSIISTLVKSEYLHQIVYDEREAGNNGNRVRISPKANRFKSTYTEKGIKKSPYEITIAHELGHQVSFNYGFKDTSLWYPLIDIDGKFVKNIERDESFASHFENIFRKAFNLPLRTHYSFFEGTNEPVKASVIAGDLSNPIFIDD